MVARRKDLAYEIYIMGENTRTENEFTLVVT